MHHADELTNSFFLEFEATWTKMQSVTHYSRRLLRNHWLRFVEQRRRLHSRETPLHQVRPHRYLPEKLWATYDRNSPRSSARAVADLANAATGEDFYNAAVELLRIDKNAFTDVLQRRLRDAGYYNGRATGRMTRATDRATLRFCRDIGAYEHSIHGPLYSDTAKMIVRGLADRG